MALDRLLPSAGVAPGVPRDRIVSVNATELGFERPEPFSAVEEFARLSERPAGDASR